MSTHTWLWGNSQYYVNNIANNKTFTNKVVFDKAIKLTGILATVNQANGTIKAVVYNEAGELIANSNTVTPTGSGQTLNLITPVVLSKNTNYYIGFYLTSGGTYNNLLAGNYVSPIISDSVTLSLAGRPDSTTTVYVGSGDVAPTYGLGWAHANYVLAMTMIASSIEPNVVGINPGGTPSTPGVVSTPTPTLTWSYSDPDGDIQSWYKVSVAKVGVGYVNDSGIIYSSANNYTIPASILESDAVYYWQVVATDSTGVMTSTAPQYFKVSSPPTISGSASEDLGNKNTAFSYNYSVNDADTADILNTTIKLNGTQIGSVSNAVRGQNYTIDINDTIFQSLTKNTTNTITISVTDGTYTTTKTVTFIKSNASPTINGSSSEDLGAKNSAFSYNYSVNDTDMADTLNTIIKLNGTQIDSVSNAVRGQNYTISIDEATLYGLVANTTNTILISVTDGTATTTKMITFVRTNNKPTISGSTSESLGSKNLAFDVAYSVNDIDSGDNLIITEKLNGVQTKLISNAVRGQNYTISVDETTLYGLALNVPNTILISVTDGSVTVTKTITFTRTNSKPTITNTDKNLGTVGTVAEKYTCNDIDGGTITIVEKVDGNQIRSFNGVNGTEYTTSMPVNTWIGLINGTHTYTVSVTDTVGITVTRTFTFTKHETIIQSTGLTNVFHTDIAATKILLIPNWLGIENVDILFQVCNNALDANPTWEDATSKVLLGKPYMFTNTVKTNANWAIDVKFRLALKAGATGGINFYGLGGAFE